MTSTETSPHCYTDTDGVILTIGAVDASTYYGTAPVVSLSAAHPDGDDDPVVYIDADHVEDVIAMIRQAAADARALPATTDGTGA